ncbi:GNAT family N-acetyltransferase, partial [Vibrio cholerae]
WSLPYMMSVDNNVVGFCGFKDEPQDGEVEIGYNVSPYKQGRGFAKLAVNQLCQLAFNVDSIESFVALISSANLASLNVVRANHFVFIGFVVDSDNEKLENGCYSGHPVPNKRLKRDCQRVAFPVPMSRGGCSCCV